MNRALLGLGIVAIGLACGCSSTSSGKDDKAAAESAALEANEEPAEKRRLLLGKVASIGQGFVLVRQMGKVRPREGTPLLSVDASSGGKSATLSWSPENSAGFFVADIVDGTPTVGDAVMAELDQMLEGLEDLTPLADPTGGVGTFSQVPASVSSAGAEAPLTSSPPPGAGAGGLTRLEPAAPASGVIWPGQREPLMELKAPVTPGEEPVFAPPLPPGVHANDGGGFPRLTPPPSSRNARSFNPAPPVAPENEGNFQTVPSASLGGGGR